MSWILLSTTFLKRLYEHWGTCVSFNSGFLGVYAIIARTWKQPRCPSADEWIRKCGTYTQWSITQPLKRIHVNQF